MIEAAAAAWTHLQDDRETVSNFVDHLFRILGSQTQRDKREARYRELLKDLSWPEWDAGTQFMRAVLGDANAEDPDMAALLETYQQLQELLAMVPEAYRPGVYLLLYDPLAKK